MTPASTGLSRVVEARGLFLLEAFVALNAVGGALYGLLGADRVPRAWLEGSPFDSYVVPSLVLQPLLENAIGHGIEPLPGGGTVTVRGWCEDDSILFEVANPLPANGAASSRKGNRMALDNVRERLELAFPGRSGLEVRDGDGRFCVRLRFPYVGDGRADPTAEPEQEPAARAS